jgi:hypothetical protein
VQKVITAMIILQYFFSNTMQLLKKKFENAKEVITSRNRRTDSTMAKRKRRKGQTMIYKTLHRKQHNPNLKPGVKLGAPPELSALAPLLPRIVLLLNDTNII